MLKPSTQTQCSPVSSPRFHYAPTKLGSATPQPGLFKSKSQVTLSPSKPPHVVQYVDAGTQWSPIMSSKMDDTPLDLKSAPEKQPAQLETLISTVPSTLPPSPTKPALEPESPTMKKRHIRDEEVSAVSSIVTSSPKRTKPAQLPVKTLPARYEFCEVEDMVIIISNMISELIQTNDRLPLRDGVLTRFHSR